MKQLLDKLEERRKYLEYIENERAKKLLDELKETKKILSREEPSAAKALVGLGCEMAILLLIIKVRSYQPTR